MANILHTADVHLAADNPERRKALVHLLDRAETEDVDLLTIGGDLFDSEVDADELRADLRDRFSNLPFSVLAIPGNHDEEAFREDLFFGEDFQAAVDEPFEHVTLADGEVRLTCLPYTPRPTEDLLVEFNEREAFEGTEILILHCSLEAPFTDATVGDEATQRYFPIGKATLAELGFDYYLAGHYHSAHRVELPNGGTFVYPGSPASVTQSETNQRSAVLLDADADSLELPVLDTFHYDHREFQVIPGEEDRTIEAIEDWVAPRTERNVEASITVSGHIEMDEPAFNDALEAASEPIPVDHNWTTVREVLGHPLYQSFLDELETREYEDEALQEAVKRRAMRVFSELETRGRLS